MSRSEFRWNKKRKHYAYLFKDIGRKRINILISSKPFVLRKGRIVFVNIPLYRHPNPKYKNYKRKIKRLKKGRRTRY